MEFEVLDLTISCRLCLVPIVDNAIDLYAEQLMVQLETVFQVSFQKEEWYPRAICSECQTLVAKIHNFVQKVRANQDYLQSLNLSEEEAPELNSKGTLVVIEECSGDEIKEEPILAEDNTVEITSDNENDQHREPTDGNQSESDEKCVSDVLHSEVEIQDCSEDDTEDKPTLAEENTVKIISDKENDQHQEPTDGNLPENDEICNLDETTGKKSPEKRKLKQNQSVRTNHSEEDDLIRRYYEFRCDLCPKEAPNFKALLAHFREKHNICGYIKCCNKKLYRRCRLLEHISKHLDPDTFRCGICNKVYSCRTSLDLHNMHMHLSDSDKPHKCPVCSKSFAKDYQLKTHMVRHIAVECPECGRIMSSRLSLREHLIKMHSHVGQKSFVCDICGKEFRSKLSFERHILLHQGIVPDNRIQCHLCPRWLANKIGLQKHIRTQHIEAGDKFVCGDCGKIAPNSAALQQHRRVVHSELKFACEMCGKKFKRAISLKEHRAIHTGESLYSCRFCPTTFISNANMYSHQKKMHPDEWQKRKADIQEKTGTL
ncbi:transcription factor grauzone-like [Armigeres subalbatus]|uniref:transcription factor grauzone-like n=1 Tax=Armigeres subalbatus TaxID=124917 RepID=UPI002ED42C5F